MKEHRSEPVAMPAGLVALAGLLLWALAGEAEAVTRYVANNGVDSDSCGSLSSPCRSLSKAIAHANPRDRIVVGPGKYGDLDDDGIFEPEYGEEAAEVGTGCYCMIKVNKQLTILPRTWAGETVLDANGADAVVVRVVAEGSGAVFGNVRKGFTLIGSARSGLVTEPNTNNVTVGGNLAIGNTNEGFYLHPPSSGHLLRGNLAIGNGRYGFALRGSGHWANGNLSVANGYHGFDLDGSLHRATNNTASANGTSPAFSPRGSGFGLAGSEHSVTGNVASANGFTGFEVNGSGHVLMGNTAHGNIEEGIRIVTGDLLTISRNNLAGNDPDTNCGMGNLSGGTVVATNNFWGTAVGPGLDPGDGACDFNAGSVTNTAPFATKAFRIVARTPF
jgi:hypothetical protein